MLEWKKNYPTLAELAKRRLELAAKPFVEYLRQLPEDLPDDTPVTNGLRGPGRLTVGDLRALEYATKCYGE